jgi:Domain of unknown function (DUF222)/HNH endonuclease
MWERAFVSESDLADLPIDRLEAAIASLADELGSRLERWLALVAEFDRRGGARRWGFRGTAEWLAWQCGLTQRTARDHVQVARALVERPLVREGLARGELSYSKVRALSRAPAGENEAALVDLARASTADDVERAVRALRSAPSADVDAARRAHARRFVDWSWEPDGSLSIRGRLPAEDGAAFVEMIETAAAAIQGAPAPHAVGAAVGVAAQTPGSDGASAGDDGGELPSDDLARRPPLGARRADALAEIAHSGSPRTQVVLHVDQAALGCSATVAAERAGETCALEDGPAIPSETARRLACDAALVIARRADDGSIDYGRARRVVPAALRTALERRDRHCRFPGCERRHDLHAHHVQHWAHGGATRKDNLVLLCRFHHRLLHEDGFTVQRSREGALHFCRPDGRRVLELPPRHRGPASARGQPIAA